MRERRYRFGRVCLDIGCLCTCLVSTPLSVSLYIFLYAAYVTLARCVPVVLQRARESSGVESTPEVREDATETRRCEDVTTCSQHCLKTRPRQTIHSLGTHDTRDRGPLPTRGMPFSAPISTHKRTAEEWSDFFTARHDIASLKDQKSLVCGNSKTFGPEFRDGYYLALAKLSRPRRLLPILTADLAPKLGIIDRDLLPGVVVGAEGCLGKGRMLFAVHDFLTS